MSEAPSGRPPKRTYARMERERRFVLDALPAEVDPGDDHRLRDTLVEGCVRRVEEPDGTEVATKLGQKLPDPDAPEDPRHRRMTTIYLAPGEASALRFDGARSVKRRATLDVAGMTWAIDVWDQGEAVAGLVLAEVECDTDEELDAVAPPEWVHAEVTDDTAYSAFSLARGAQVASPSP